MSVIIQYAEILHEHGVYSREAKDFRADHREDGALQARANVLDKCFLNRDAILGSHPVPQPATAALPT